MSIDQKLKELGIEIPRLDIPQAAFKPYVVHEGILIVSGQVPLKDGKPFVMGSVPEVVPIEKAKEAARLCVINVLAWAKHACNDDLDQISRVLKLGGYVVTSNGFTNAPEIINAASLLITAIFGEAGEHARIAIGVASLPAGVPVEIEATFALRK